MSENPEEMPDNATDRPLVSFTLLAYNHEKYIRKAVEGAFTQTYEQLEIILSDDCSSDQTFEIIKEMAEAYDGPHRVVLNANPKNLGIGLHVNKLMGLSQGEIIVAAAGDDISHPDRVEKIVNKFLTKQERPFSVWSSAQYIDNQGNELDQEFKKPSKSQTDTSMVRNFYPVIGATHAWDRRVFDFFGPLMPSIVFEDNAISFRSYLLGDIAFIDEELVDYRTHTKNLTNFTKISNSVELYFRAATRIRWAIVGVDQRMRDLEFAINELGSIPRDQDLMRTELATLKRKMTSRLEIYKSFPNISLRSLSKGLGDILIMKAFVRSAIKITLNKLKL
jgi:glycosyltransferase involved in cell wall biosynthesis